MKITIGKKLFGGFLFVLTLLVVVSIYSNKAIHTTQESYEKLMDVNMSNMILAQKLENYYMKQCNAVRGYLLSGNETYIFQFEGQLANSKRTIKEMKQAFKNNEDQLVVNQLEGLLNRYEELARKGMSFKQEKNEDGYTNLMGTSAKTITNVFQAQIRNLVKGQEQLMEVGRKEVEMSVADTKMFVTYLGFISVIIGTLLSFWIGRSISRPLYILAKHTESMFQKEHPNPKSLTIHSSTYEVKQLYQSINLMMKQVYSHINQLNVAIQIDALTNIANRRSFDKMINQHVQNKVPFSLLFIDIDFFKKVNDRFGHLVGDDVLRYLAKTMKELSRDGDLCFRYGGEEFAIIVPYSDYDTAYSIAERLRKKIEKTNCPTGEPITISLGISFYPEHGEIAKEIIAAADAALYQSKSNGRNFTTVYPTLTVSKTTPQDSE